MSRIWFLLAGKVILFFYIQDCNSTVSVVEYYSSLFWCSCAFVCSITAEQRMKHDIHGAASPGSSSIVCLWRKIIYQQIVVYRSGKLSAIEAECVVWDIVTTRSASLAWPSLVLLRKWKSRQAGHICTGSSVMLFITSPRGLWECFRNHHWWLWPAQAMLRVEDEVHDLGTTVTKEITRKYL